MTSEPEVVELQNATEKLLEHSNEILADWDQPLTFSPLAEPWVGKRIEAYQRFLERYEAVDSKRGRCRRARRHLAALMPPQGVSGPCQVASGILWIPGPFKEKFWPDRKPVKPKHTCPECGAKHMIRVR